MTPSVDRHPRPHKDKPAAASAKAPGQAGERVVVLLVFDGVELLDVAGPASIFSKAQGPQGPAYDLQLVSPRGGVVCSNAGVQIGPTQPMGPWAGAVDTLLIAGGDEAALRTAILDEGVGAWLARVGGSARRVASICTGAFALGAAGWLEGRQCTTHWNACEQLQALFPAARVRGDRICVRDGPVWTSAGVSTGLELALALVEDDLGREEAMRIARTLALPALRGGAQAQISPVLEAQADAAPRLRDLIAWIPTHLAQDLRVPALAQRVAMSPRNFARAFVHATGQTPARFVAHARLQMALQLLGQTDWPQDKVAQRSGYASVDALQRSVCAATGTSAQRYRQADRA